MTAFVKNILAYSFFPGPSAISFLGFAFKSRGTLSFVPRGKASERQELRGNLRPQCGEVFIRQYGLSTRVWNLGVW